MSAPIDLDALDQAVAAMSSGPWTLDPTDDDIIAPDDAVKHPDGSTGNVVGYLYVEQDWNGIVALRNAAPALIAEVRKLRDQFGKAEQLGMEARDALTAWLDAPRLAARKTPTVVAERNGCRLLTTSAGEWGVADDESPAWLSCEAEARYEFRAATGTASCELCARFIDRDNACVDADGIYACADETACSAAIAALEAL